MSPNRPPAAPRPPPRLPGVFLRLGPQMRAMDDFLHAQMEAFEPEIRAMAEYCLDVSGKRIRPALVFFAGWPAEGKIFPDLVRAAAVVELVHLATLVHDDIMDEAELRRNRRTAAYEYGPAAAVLVGDALFAHALHLAAQFPTTAVCLAVAESTRRVCAGEILQTLRRRSTTVTRDDYLRVIDLKTGELFRVSCFLGALLSGHTEDYINAAANFGRRLGTAYQMYDDLADFFGDPSQIGKTLGTDLASGKITLPILALIDRLNTPERENFLAEIEGTRPLDAAYWQRCMGELDIFAHVRMTVMSEINSAEADLEALRGMPSCEVFRELSEVLRQQVESLAPLATSQPVGN